MAAHAPLGRLASGPTMCTLRSWFETPALKALEGLLFIFVSFFVVIQIGTILSGSAHAAERIALLIGNQKYKDSVGPLKNPYKDVDLVGYSLRRLGFRVKIIYDAQYKQIVSAVKEHAAIVRSAG